MVIAPATKTNISESYCCISRLNLRGRSTREGKRHDCARCIGENKSLDAVRWLMAAVPPSITRLTIHSSIYIQFYSIVNLHALYIGLERQRESKLYRHSRDSAKIGRATESELEALYEGVPRRHVSPIHVTKSIFTYTYIYIL